MAIRIYTILLIQAFAGRLLWSLLGVNLEDKDPLKDVLARTSYVTLDVFIVGVVWLNRKLDPSGMASTWLMGIFAYEIYKDIFTQYWLPDPWEYPALSITLTISIINLLWNRWKKK